MNAARLVKKRKVPFTVVVRSILRLPPNPVGLSGYARNSSADNLGVPLTSAPVSPTATVKRKKKKASGPNFLLIAGVVVGGLALVFMLKKKRGLAGYVDDAKRSAKGFIDRVG
jgi:hypothetical protein